MNITTPSRRYHHHLKRLRSTPHPHPHTCHIASHHHLHLPHHHAMHTRNLPIHSCLVSVHHPSASSATRPITAKGAFPGPASTDFEVFFPRLRTTGLLLFLFFSALLQLGCHALPNHFFSLSNTLSHQSKLRGHFEYSPSTRAFLYIVDPRLGREDLETRLSCRLASVRIHS